MTTIVASLTEMAADTRCTNGGPIMRTKKIRVIGDSVFGFAGGLFEAAAFIAWLQGDRDHAKLPKWQDENRDDFMVLELSPEGLAIWNGWGHRVPLVNQFYSIGSGSMTAMGVMHVHPDPKFAVEVASLYDENTDSNVEVISLAKTDSPAARKRKPAR